MHLGIFIEPYLQYIFEGKKTIESRFSINRSAPYGSVRKNDIFLLKKVSGAIEGFCRITDVWFYQLNQTSWNDIKNDYADAICASSPDFWEEKQKARYATLMLIDNVTQLSPISINKQDRRGWVTLSASGSQQNLFNKNL